MRLLAILFGLAFAANAFAESAEVSITGRIFPGACTVSLGNGGVVNLGDINTRQLDPDAATTLDPVALSLTVVCESPVRFAFQGTDNTGDTSAVQGMWFGLGLTNAGEKIGGARLLVGQVTADGDAAHGTESEDNGATWKVSGSAGESNVIGQTNLQGFAKTAGVDTGPDPIRTLNGTVEVIARIVPLNELTIGDEVLINGSVTLDLIYR